MAETGTESVEHAVTMDAVESLVLWPSPFVAVDTALDNGDPWPVFVVVVDIDSAGDPTGGAALTELLARSRSPLDTISHSHCRWSVADSHRALLRLAVQVFQPTELTLDVTVPGQCFLGLSDIVAAGATLGVTTRGSARRLTARADDRRVLDHVVLLGSRTSRELGQLADLLCRTMRMPNIGG